MKQGATHVFAIVNPAFIGTEFGIKIMEQYTIVSQKNFIDTCNKLQVPKSEYSTD